MKGSVLVSVLKSPSDLRILLEEKWYRIPRAFLPKRKFTHVALYQPQTAFGRRGKCIRYYARVTKKEVKKRIDLLPNERAHPRAQDEYLKCSFRTVKELAKPIRNIIPRRVSFGFTTLNTLRSARDILQLYGVPPTEQLVLQRLKQLNIPFTSQYRVNATSHFSLSSLSHYRLDLAVFCRRGNIAVECDNRKAHASKTQRQKDRQKDSALCRLGWRVIRLTEADIVERLDGCISQIQTSIRAQGGVRV